MMHSQANNFLQILNAIQAPLIQRIADLEKKVAKMEGDQRLDYKPDGERPALRRNVVAKAMGISASTLDRYIRDPLCPLEGVKRGRKVYVFIDSIKKYERDNQKTKF